MSKQTFRDYLDSNGLPTGFLRFVDWGRTAPKAVRPEPWCYVIQQGDSGPVKVGVAIDPTKRLADLQVANHEPLRIVATLAGGYETEARLHRELGAHSIRGEWFRPAALPLITACTMPQ